MTTFSVFVLSLLAQFGPSLGDTLGKTTIIDAPAVRIVDGDTSAGERLRFNLSGGKTLTILNSSAVIKDRDGKTVAENRNLIRIPDVPATCPSRGFIDILTNEKGFAIHQQTCSGWYFIDETLKFELSSEGHYQLREVVLRYFDRRSPESDDVVEALTPNDFGSIKFEDYRLEEAYKHLPGNKGKK